MEDYNIIIHEENAEYKQDIILDVLDKVEPEKFSILFMLLESIKLYKINKTAKRSRFQGVPFEFATFGIVKERLNTPNGKSYSLSAYSKKHPGIHDAIFEFGKNYCPFIFNSVYVIKNAKTPRHKDGNNVGLSMLVSFGDYTGGHINISTGQHQPTFTHDANLQPIVFDACKYEHWNEAFIGDKYSMVFYNLPTSNVAV